LENVVGQLIQDFDARAKINPQQKLMCLVPAGYTVEPVNESSVRLCAIDKSYLFSGRTADESDESQLVFPCVFNDAFYVTQGSRRENVELHELFSTTGKWLSDFFSDKHPCGETVDAGRWANALFYTAHHGELGSDLQFRVSQATKGNIPLTTIELCRHPYAASAAVLEAWSDGRLTEGLFVSDAHAVRQQIPEEEFAPLLTRYPDEGTEWSEAKSPSEWVAIFVADWRTIKKRIDAGTYIAEELNAKLWRFDVRSIPAAK
jgi:hypothetical protein